MLRRNSKRWREAPGEKLIWFALFAAVLVLFPFEWLNNVWPAYAQVFHRIFATALAHRIGHMTIFLLAGLLVLCLVPRLRLCPLFYAIILVLGALGEELLQAFSLDRWQLSEVLDWNAFTFDTLGFVLTYLLVWLWWRFRGTQKNDASQEIFTQV